MRRNYQRKLSEKLSVKIISENYDLVYQSHRKVEIYRDTGVSNNVYSKTRIFDKYVIFNCPQTSNLESERKGLLLNLLILNISSFEIRIETCFEMLKSSEHETLLIL